MEPLFSTTAETYHPLRLSAEPILGILCPGSVRKVGHALTSEFPNNYNRPKGIFSVIGSNSGRVGGFVS